MGQRKVSIVFSYHYGDRFHWWEEVGKRLTFFDRLTWSNGDRYDGDFVDGRREGKGVMVLINGDRYEGIYYIYFYYYYLFIFFYFLLFLFFFFSFFFLLF